MNNYHNIIQALKKAIQMEPGEPYKNRAIANAAFIALKNAVFAIPGTQKSKYISHVESTTEIKQFLDNLRFDADYQSLVFMAGKMLQEGKPLPLVQREDKILLSLCDLGEISTGVFSVADFHQIALVFHDPLDSKSEIGFSLNSDAGLCITIPPKRLELYPSFSLYTISESGYETGYGVVVKEIYTEKGEVPKQSLWDWFLNL
jgi:hypothetical protein